MEILSSGELANLTSREAEVAIRVGVFSGIGAGNTFDSIEIISGTNLSDTFIASAGADRVNGGTGLDMISYSLKLIRVAVAGGDTSGTVTRALGITALQIAAPISPGAPLCYGLLRRGGRIEIALKGGQMGADDFFCRVRDL